MIKMMNTLALLGLLGCAAKHNVSYDPNKCYVIGENIEEGILELSKEECQDIVTRKSFEYVASGKSFEGNALSLEIGNIEKIISNLEKSETGTLTSAWVDYKGIRRGYQELILGTYNHETEIIDSDNGLTLIQQRFGGTSTIIFVDHNRDGAAEEFYFGRQIVDENSGMLKHDLKKDKIIDLKKRLPGMNFFDKNGEYQRPVDISIVNKNSINFIEQSFAYQMRYVHAIEFFLNEDKYFDLGFEGGLLVSK